MIARSIQLLTDLHDALFYIGGHIGLAPAGATYPLVTYTIINSSDSPSKSFTTEGNVFTVQFSYFDDGSFLNCLNLAAQVEDILSGMSDVLYVDKGNLLMVANTQKSKLFQCIDTRQVEIVQEGGAGPTYTVTYNSNGADGYTRKQVQYAQFVGLVLEDGSDLGMEGHEFDGWNTKADGTGTEYAAGDTVTDLSVTLYAQWVIPAPVGITYAWNGLVDGDFSNPMNYTPNGIPTGIDIVNVDDTAAIMPNAGTLACDSLTLSNTQIGVVDVNLGFGLAEDAITANLITFTSGTTNYANISNDITFTGVSYNFGFNVQVATMIPVEDVEFPGFWLYPTNNGYIGTANCHWVEGDRQLGGQYGTVNYLGYPQT